MEGVGASFTRDGPRDRSLKTMITIVAFLADAAQHGNYIVEMLDRRGGNFWATPYRFVMTIFLSALTIWLVVRILKSKD